MSICLVYSSLTGNTRKVAEAMASALGIRAQQVRGISTLKGVNLLFVGSGVYARRPSRAVSRFLRRLPTLQGVKVVLFGTYGTSSGQLDRMARLVQEKGGEILGRFSCKGRDWLTLGLIAREHPNSTDLDAAAAFARRMRKQANRG